MQTYHFKPKLENIADGEIFSAERGNGYVKDGELHITENSYHFVYKFGAETEGWYMHNANTDEDVYLDEGASPTAEYETVNVESQEAWDAIIQPEDDAEETAGVE